MLNTGHHRYGMLGTEEYDKPGSTIDSDIIDMLNQMTLAEKIGQMTQMDQELILQKDGSLNRTAVEYYAKNYYVGSYLNQLANHGKNFDVVDYAKLIEEIQEITLSVNSTLKVPIIYGLDHIHGAHYVANTTIFPHGINLAASFNPQLAYESASITARDTRAAGVQWTFAPVLDIPVNKQWPRVYENFGEDPHLSSVMGVAAIRGYQGKYKSDRTKVAACMKHFIAYGAPWSGQDRDSTVVSDRTIYDFFVPGFQAAIDAGVATAMESYIDVNGEPVVSSNKYLRKLLRDQMGFQGMLVTDWQEIENLHDKHMVAATHKEAVRMAIADTSIDMSMVPKDVVFFDSMMDLVKEGKVSMERVDESVGRLLQLKKDLGLLEPNGWKADPILQQQVQNQDDVQVSIEAARESMTLLKNDNATLPLTAESVKKILVLGPTSNSLGHLSGGWTIQWQGATADLWHGDINDEQFYKKGITILEGIQNSAPKDIEVDHILGFDIHGNEQDMDWIIERIQDYDAFVVCIGEHVYSELPGNIHDLTLPQGQIENIDKLAKAAGDTPIVTVLLEGRPRTLNSIQSNSNAILQAYLPGPWGGQAIGEVLFGKTNPSGRLPYTYPKYAGDMNMNYWRPACDLFDPLYEFGHGLSYSNFEYGNITVDGQLNDASENVQMLVVGEKEKAVLVNVTNTSPVDGKETVLMYIQQPFRTVTPPAKLLKGFQKVFIPAGETVNVRFSVNADMFRYTGLDNIPQGTIDNGSAKVLIGSQVFDFEVVDPSTE
ncbi:glycoside hydrolase superfamily [Gilbertella persicaria]|uniref:glycoside hydrolase superfamily n=1 Tax=Gilbertella persicaria TaxID=101096 RepID=UPI00221F69CE|nr:glycoside hydrolase superfamily [Gilbertella persicaria]KAI8082506.1 glycoside hydrolase superfamily [Gilbertella persicaria]